MTEPLTETEALDLIDVGFGAGWLECFTTNQWNCAMLARKEGDFEKASRLDESIHRSWECARDIHTVLALHLIDDFAQVLRINPELSSLCEVFRLSLRTKSIVLVEAAAKALARRCDVLWA